VRTPRPGSLLDVVLSPHPPLLFRELGGLADPVADLRAACLATLGRALARRPDRVVVATAVPDAGAVHVGGLPDVRRFGTTGARTGPGLPLGLGVGRRLLDDVGWSGRTDLVGLDLDAPRAALTQLAQDLVAAPDRTVVLLLGDGSARRDATGPGMLDHRAFAFDAAVVDAVRHCDARALADLDTALAEELMVLGRTALRLLGEIGLAAGAPATAEVAHESDPFGVLYLVASWSWPHA